MIELPTEADPVRILVGDCVERLRALPDGCVQTCVTSPPYYGLRDYGHAGQIGLEPTPAEYVARMVDVFREVRRVLRDDGTVWLNLGDSYASSGQSGKQDGVNEYARRERGQKDNGPKQAERTYGRAPTPEGLKPKDLIGIPWRVAFALQADGWFLRQDIIWAKPNPMPESVRDRCTKAHEYVFLLSKREQYFYDADAVKEEAIPQTRTGKIGYATPKHAGLSEQGIRCVGGQKSTLNAASGAHRNRRSVWVVTPKPFKGAHFAVMPPELVRPCVRAGSSERGACPHCGAPWVRQVERDEKPKGRSPEDVYTGQAFSSPQSAVWGPKRDLGGNAQSRTVGFAPSCECPAHEPVPCVVLDPFGGSGTTALVALEEGRRAVLCELNPEYAEMARGRTAVNNGLFAEATA